jgi:hypothetical protein
MEKKDILLFALIIVFSGISLYMRYVKKKNAGMTGGKMHSEKKTGLSGQPDDYEPYSGK